MQPFGALYEVNGCTMHLHRIGVSSRLPPIVIEAGNSMPAVAYARLQAALAPHTEVVIYDRCGLGWSENTAEPKDAAHTCERLQVLLKKAGIRTPFIIAGHSIGGLFLRVYAAMFPKEVTGAVFLDATHTRLSQVLGSRAWLQQIVDYYRVQCQAAQRGLLHEDDAAFLELFADLPHVRQQYRLAALQPLRYEVSIQMLETYAISAAQAESSGNLGDLPVLSISAPALARHAKGSPMSKVFLDAETKKSLHREFARLSARGRHMEVAGADHGTLTAHPDFVAVVAREMHALAQEAGR